MYPVIEYMIRELGTVLDVDSMKYFALLFQNHYFDINNLKIVIKREKKGTLTFSINPLIFKIKSLIVTCNF